MSGYGARMKGTTQPQSTTSTMSSAPSISSSSPTLVMTQGVEDDSGTGQPADDILDAISEAGGDVRMPISTTPARPYRAKLLLSGPVISKLATWCRKHSKSRKDSGVKPTLAVVYFDTGADSRLFYRYKAIIAAKVGVSVTGYKMLPDAPIDDVLDTVAELNEDEQSHGILIQRSVPSHLCEEKVIDSVTPAKDVERYTTKKANNIALDALTRVLDLYGKAAMLDLNVILLGGSKIITPQFRTELEQRHRRVHVVQSLEPDMLRPAQDTIVITELNKGGIITADMLGPAIKLIVDLGFDGISKQGDLDPDVFDVDGLLVVPTPHGVMPVLLWIMMERTIMARNRSERSQISCAPGCSVL